MSFVTHIVVTHASASKGTGLGVSLQKMGRGKSIARLVVSLRPDLAAQFGWTDKDRIEVALGQEEHHGMLRLRKGDAGSAVLSYRVAGGRGHGGPYFNLPLGHVDLYVDRADGTQGETSFAAALEASESKPIQALLVDLAPIVAAGLSLSPNAAKTGAAVLAAAKPSPRFDAPAYFAALSKPLLHEAWRDMRSPLDRDFKGLADAPLADMAKRVEALAFDTKWLPPQLRTPAYDGPSFATKAPPADEPVEQMQAAE